MPNEISEVLNRARREYSNKDITSFVTNGLRFAARDFWLEKLIDSRSISRSQLQHLANKENKIWYMPEEDPICITPPDHNLLRQEFNKYPTEYDPEQSFICELSDCHIVGKNAVTLTRDNRLITETATVYKTGSLKKLGLDFEHYLRISGMRKKPAAKYSQDRVFPLVTPYSSYYHWVVEYLPKLRLLEHYKKETGNKPTVLVESNPRRFVQQTLEAVGYPPSSYEAWNRNEAYVNKILVATHRTHLFNYFDPKSSNYNPSRSDLNWLRRKVRSGLSTTETSSNKKRIYISRQEVDSQHTSSRKVLNFDENKKIFEKFGFKSYILENLSFRKQMEIFADADVIMGPHGAGLVNMIFSSDPLVIELFPDNKIKPHFYFISDLMDFEYEAIVSDSKGSDLIIDPDTLHNRLELFL